MHAVLKLSALKYRPKGNGMRTQVMDKDAVLQEIERRKMKPLRSLEQRPGDFETLVKRYDSMPNARANRRAVILRNACYQIMVHEGIYYGVVNP